MSTQFQVTPLLENCRSNYMSNDEEDIVVFINGQLLNSDTSFFAVKFHTSLLYAVINKI